MTDLQYRHCAAEDLVKEGKQFDVVCAMEVIEHVEDATGFLDCLSDLTKVRRFVSFPDSFLPGLSAYLLIAKRETRNETYAAGNEKRDERTRIMKLI